MDAKHIPELMDVSVNADGSTTLGAAVPCHQLYNDAQFTASYPAVVDAARIIGSTGIQGRASVGGNLCNSGPAGDTIPALIVHSAVCNISGPDGERTVAVEDFCTAPGRNVMQDGELLVSLTLPKPAAGSGTHYLRFIPRNEMDIAVVGAGALPAVGRRDASRRPVYLAWARWRPRRSSFKLLVTPWWACQPTKTRSLIAADIARDAAVADRRHARHGGPSQAVVLRSHPARPARRQGIAPREAVRPMATEILSGKVHVQTTINGEPVDFLAEPRESLLEVLRDHLGLTGAKEGCNNGNCGACNVVMDGTLVNSCCVLSVEAAGARPSTPSRASLRRPGCIPLQQSFLENAALQCGVCTPGLHRRGQGVAGRESESHGVRSSLVARRQPLPVHGLRQDRTRRPGCRRTQYARRLNHGH